MDENPAEYSREKNVVTGRFSPRKADPIPLRGAGGGGTFDGMEQWAQTVETRLGELRADIRQLLYLGIGATGVLLAAFAGGVVWLSGNVASGNTTVIEKLDTITEKTGEISERTARLEALQSVRPTDQP